MSRVPWPGREIAEFDEDLVIPDRSLPLVDAIAPWQNQMIGFRRTILFNLAKHYKFDPLKSVKELPANVIKLVLYGDDAELNFDVKFKTGSSFRYAGSFEGVIPQLKRMYAATDSDDKREKVRRYMRQEVCPVCVGTRLKKRAAPSRSAVSPSSRQPTSRSATHGCLSSLSP